MIYDVRTYDLRPHSVAEVEKRLGEAYERRTGGPELAASFHTEIGPLNQIVQIRPHASLEERASAEAASWFPDVGEFVVGERSQLFVPFAISPELRPGTVGPFFEVRTYRYADGDLPKIVAAWEVALPGRLEWGPMVGVWHSEGEGVNTLMHIWPYASLDARWELRAKIREAELWPPMAVARRHGLPGYKLLHMENKIVVPSAFSPLQ
jgi:hypothetical protein